MSKYTTELRYICETKAGLNASVGDNDVEEVIASARTEIFNFDYPIFSNEYKEPLESKILSHFYTREIGCETYGLWHLRLRNKMNEIMPYYNKLYESELFDYEPLDDTNYYEDEAGSLNTSGTSSDNTTGNVSESTEGSKSGTNSGQNNMTGTVTDTGTKSEQSNMTGTVTDAGTHADTTVDRFHDTPQGAIADLSDSQYLTNVRQINNNGTDGNTKTYDTQNDISGTDSNTKTYNTQNNTSGTDSETTEVERTTETSVVSQKANSQSTQNVLTKHVHGKRSGVSYNKLLKEYRANLLNIDMKVIGELEELFIQLW